MGMVRLAMVAAAVVSLSHTTLSALSALEDVVLAPPLGIDEDEFKMCGAGSACREDLRIANGRENDMWPDLAFRTKRERVNQERNRLRLNQYQPAVVPAYTQLGYKKEKLDPEAYSYLMEWFRAPVRVALEESWPPDNTYVNHWAVGTKMTNSPRRVHKVLYEALQPAMEKWAGTKLKATSCYGVRSYYRGSVLANHVDRVDTHVISAIINVAQDNLDEEWPLYVRGHDGVAKHIFIKPGEVIFYESASVIHGRPEPFQGDSFSNIFVHFAPQEGWTVTAKDVDHASAYDIRQQNSEKIRARRSDEL